MEEHCKQADALHNRQGVYSRSIPMVSTGRLVLHYSGASRCHRCARLRLSLGCSSSKPAVLFGRPLRTGHYTLADSVEITYSAPEWSHSGVILPLRNVLPSNAAGARFRNCFAVAVHRLCGVRPYAPAALF